MLGHGAGIGLRSLGRKTVQLIEGISVALTCNRLSLSMGASVWHAQLLVRNVDS